MGGQLVRGLDEGFQLRVVLQHIMGVAGTQLGREHVQQTVARNALHLFVGGFDVRIVVFDGRGQVAGQDLRSVVVQRRHGAAVGVGGGEVQNVPADQRQSMGQHRGHVAVLGNVFGKGVAHQTPAGYVAHTAHQGVKFICHG